ncbi:hypothetical protein [Microcoleus sp. D3_18a_C4]|uniref:hypothetical protein n=1 Tax=unclassified Microcoleus TaxID=2642155 RepID=UPI002FD33671
MPATLYYYFDRDSNLCGKRASDFFYEPLSRRTTGGTPVPQRKRREEEEFTGAGRIATYA